MKSSGHLPRTVLVSSLILLAAVLPARAAQQGDFNYEDNGASITITSYTGGGGAVAIPDLIAGKPVSSIGNLAFSSVAELTSVTIPNTVTTIGNEAFSHCLQLTSVTIPNSVTFIGEGAFAFSASVASFTIPNSVTSIGDYTFQGCYGLTNVTIHAGVTDIGQGAFGGCAGLTNVTIPNGVTTIAIDAFAGCIGLSSISVDLLNPAYSSLDGVLFNKGQTTLTRYPAGKIGSYAIPNSVTYLADTAFSECSGLTSVTIPNSVTAIGFAAFSGCIGLRSIYFIGNPPSLGSLGGSPRGYPSATLYYQAGATGWGSTFDGRPTVLWIETEDLDHDGMNNQEEMLAGTDPMDSNSLLAFEGAPRPEALEAGDQTVVPPSQHALYFQTIPGTRYEILSTETLGGEWSSVITVSASTSQKRVMVDKPARAAFYRIRVLTNP